MRNYNYNELLDFRTFEYFAKSIIEIKENKEFEIFAENKDKGIDLRNIENNFCTIVQVKRYKNVKMLIDEIEKTELAKIKKLKPDRYIIITSAKLTVGNKERIQEILKDIPIKSEDIIGCEQLNSLLEKEEYKKVEEEYYQLWINSTRTLDNFIKKNLHADIYNYTKDELDNIKQSTKIYVKHEKFEEALEIIKEKRCLLICGEPEIGKSTLARNLCAYLMNKNKEIEFIYSNNVSKIANLLENDKQQLFFVDDFWGSKFDGNLNAEEENNLKRIIQIITKSKNKILILTSREYILSQGYAEYPELEEFFDNYKLNLHIQDYSKLFKAQILFKHLSNSELDIDAIYQIAYGYEYIISNPNYRPRIVENYIKYVEDKEIEITNYLNDFIEYLNHPNKLWKEIFEKQREGAQLITILILLLDEEHRKLEYVKILYEKYIEYDLKIDAKKKDFGKYISQLENTLITTYEDEWIGRGHIFVDFKNSSIENYIYKQFMENLGEYAKNLIESTPYINVIMYLLNSWNTLTKYRKNAEEQEGIYYDNQIQNELICLARKRLIKDLRKLVFIDEDLTEDYCESKEFRVHKIIICLDIYQKYPNENMKEFIKEQSLEILKELKENNYFDYIDLFSIPRLIGKLKNTGIISNIDVIEKIEDTFKAIRVSKQILVLKYFEEEFTREYKYFYEQNKSKIISLIYSLIFKDADYFLSDNLYQDLNELAEITIPSLFDNFNLKYTDEFVKEFYELTDIKLVENDERMYENINYEEIEKRNIEYEKNQKKQEQEEKNILQEKELLLSSLYDNFIEQDEVEEYLEGNLKNKSLIQELISLFLDYNRNYIRAFMDNFDSLELLVNFINWLDRIPINSKDFFENFIQYVMEQNKKITKYIIQKLKKLAYDMFKEGRNYLFKREILEVFQDDLLEELLESGLIYKIKKKYYFQTIYLHLYLALIEMIEEKEDLSEIYEKQEKGSFKDLFNDICYTYSDIDLKDFNENFLKVQIDKVIEEVEDININNAIMKFIEKYEIEVDMDVEINIEEDMINNGNSIKADVSILALEYLGFNIIDMVCKPIDMEEIKSLFIKAYKNTSATISLKDDLKNRRTLKYKLLEKLGYVQYLEEFYQYLLICKKTLNENIEANLRISFDI